MLTKLLYERGSLGGREVELVYVSLGGALPKSEIRSLAEFRSRVGLAGRPVKLEVPLESSWLGVRGRVDILEGSYPVEAKYRGKLLAADVLQLAVYALLLEEESVYADVGYVDLLKARRRVPVRLTSALKDRAKALIAKLKRACLEPVTPRSPPCRACDLRAECRLLFPEVLTA